MKIIDRYIGRELFVSMGLGLTIFTFALLMQKILELMDLIITKRVPVGIVTLLFVYTLPALFVTTTPLALLLAVIATYGRLAADHELTALKATGCSLYRLALPAFGVGLVAMLFTLFNTLYALPHGSQAFRDLLFFLARTRATIGIQERIFNDDFHGLVLYANHLEEGSGVMEGVFLVDTHDEENPRIITARHGRVTPDERKNVVLLELQKGATHVTPKGKPGRYQILGFQTLKLALSLSNPRTAGLRFRQPEELTLAELLATAQEHQASGGRTEYLMVSFHRRFAAPAACLVFILIGTPLAIRVRRSGRGISIGLTMLLAMSYYVLMISGQGLGNNGTIPPFLASWLPNLVLGSVGLILFIGGNHESWLPPSLLEGWKHRAPRVRLR
ncbi:MAG: LPS export ABC transporter permease LptF [Candidatus Methylomirabilales bacterium]